MLLNLLVIISLCKLSDGHNLKQVFVLSRHNIRTPFGEDMSRMSPKKLPSWKLNPGSLTPKGYVLERGMGKYFSDWMIEQKLFDNKCPKNDAFVYANTKHRTKETAKSFTEGAFGECVNVYYKNNTEEDPVFVAIIRNASVEFKEAALNEMKAKLNKIDLKNAFLELNIILDFGNSSYCNTSKVCDLSEAKSDVFFEVNELPDIRGALRIGAGFVDSFLMAYYEGLALENVAWGQIQTMEQWETLMAVLKIFHDLCLKNSILSKDLASPLLEYITDMFQCGKKKFYLLVGHDVNINLLTFSLNFKEYILHDQIEKTPIGGKIVFQKWYDEENDQDLLRVNYVYMSTKQIRDGVEVSLQNPPQWQILEMENCTVDENGFCPWNDFLRILNTL